MTQDEQVQQDIRFLLSFCPAYKTESVFPGLSPMFYLTGTYNGDVALVTRIEEIIARYQINKDIIEVISPGAE